MLPASNRLCENRDFRFIYSRAKSYVHPLAVVYVLRHRGAGHTDDLGNPVSRIGFVVSKKQGGAVVRNRIKRRMREAIRARWDDLKAAPYDVIIVGRKRLHTAAWQDVVDAIDDLLARSGVIHARPVNEAPK